MVGIAVPMIMLSSMASSIAIMRASSTTRTLRRGGAVAGGPADGSSWTVSGVAWVMVVAPPGVREKKASVPAGYRRVEAAGARRRVPAAEVNLLAARLAEYPGS